MLYCAWCYGFVTNAIFSPDVADTEEVEGGRERERDWREGGGEGELLIKF